MCRMVHHNAINLSANWRICQVRECSSGRVCVVRRASSARGLRRTCAWCRWRSASVSACGAVWRRPSPGPCRASRSRDRWSLASGSQNPAACLQQRTQNYIQKTETHGNLSRCTVYNCITYNYTVHGKILKTWLVVGIQWFGHRNEYWNSVSNQQACHNLHFFYPCVMGYSTTDSTPD